MHFFLIFSFFITRYYIEWKFIGFYRHLQFLILLKLMQLQVVVEWSIWLKVKWSTCFSCISFSRSRIAISISVLMEICSSSSFSTSYKYTTSFKYILYNLYFPKFKKRREIAWEHSEKPQYLANVCLVSNQVCLVSSQICYVNKIGLFINFWRLVKKWA